MKPTTILSTLMGMSVLVAALPLEAGLDSLSKHKPLSPERIESVLTELNAPEPWEKRSPQKKIDAVDVEKRQKKIDAIDVEKRSPQKKIDAVDVEKRQKKIDAVDVE